MTIQLTEEYMGQTASQISRALHGEQEDARILVIDDEGDARLAHIGTFGTLWVRPDGTSVTIQDVQ